MTNRVNPVLPIMLTFVPGNALPRGRGEKNWANQLVSLNRISNSNLARSVFTETLETILTLAFSPDGQFLATGDANNEVRLWQVSDGRQAAICKGHTDWVRSVSFSPDGKTLISGGGDKSFGFSIH
jgi:WD40 repeat protein